MTDNIGYIEFKQVRVEALGEETITMRVANVDMYIDDIVEKFKAFLIAIQYDKDSVAEIERSIT